MLVLNQGISIKTSRLKSFCFRITRYSGNQVKYLWRFFSLGQKKNEVIYGHKNVLCNVHTHVRTNKLVLLYSPPINKHTINDQHSSKIMKNNVKVIYITVFYSPHNEK